MILVIRSLRDLNDVCMYVRMYNLLIDNKNHVLLYTVSASHFWVSVVNSNLVHSCHGYGSDLVYGCHGHARYISKVLVSYTKPPYSFMWLLPSPYLWWPTIKNSIFISRNKILISNFQVKRLDWSDFKQFGCHCKFWNFFFKLKKIFNAFKKGEYVKLIL